MEIIDKILEAKSKGSYIHIPSSHEYRMDWNECISLLEKMKRSVDPDFSKNNDKRFIGSENGRHKIIKYNHFDYVLFNTEDTSDKMANIFNYIKSFMPKHDHLATDIIPAMKTLINFVGDEGQYGIHPDPHDVITMQLLGQVEYRIYENVPEDRIHHPDSNGLIYKSYMLKPGDIFYMKSGVIHQAVVSEPRITTILDIYNF
jgi:hypothetical protein